MQREGQLADALVWLKKAVELEPDKADFWEWLAELYDEMEEPGESIPCWERVLAPRARSGGAASLAGWALQEGGRLTEARDHYLTAIRAAARHGAAYMNLGGLHEELGDLAEAEAAFRTALEAPADLRPAACPPGDVAAGQTARRGPGGARGAAGRRKLGQGPRARLLFALGPRAGRPGRLRTRADCLQEANAITRELTRGTHATITAADHERFVDGLMRAFDRGLFGRLAGAGSDTAGGPFSSSACRDRERR